MKGLRIYATPDGGSHFDDVDLPTTKRSVHPDAMPFDARLVFASAAKPSTLGILRGLDHHGADAPRD